MTNPKDFDDVYRTAQTKLPKITDKSRMGQKYMFNSQLEGDNLFDEK